MAKIIKIYLDLPMICREYRRLFSVHGVWEKYYSWTTEELWQTDHKTGEGNSGKVKLFVRSRNECPAIKSANNNNNNNKITENTQPIHSF